MAGCSPIAELKPNACSGKCRGAACRSTPRIWVAAACNGMVALYLKNDDEISLLPKNGDAVFSSLESFTRRMVQAEEAHAFDQLVIVGAKHDIAWMQAALPSAVAKFVAAEIDYPLMASWFTGADALTHLTRALENVLTH